LWREKGSDAANQVASLELILRAFIEAGDLNQARQALESYPQLLTDEAFAHLKRLIQIQLDPRAQRSLQMRLALLERCREVGINAAFDLLTPPSAPHTEEVVQVNSDEPDEYLVEMAEALHANEQFRGTKDSRFLDDAIQHWIKAIDHPKFVDCESDIRVEVFNLYGVCCLDRYDITAAGCDLDRAAEAFRKAITEAPSGHEEVPGILRNLAQALKQRFQIDGTPSDLDRVISIYDQLVDLTTKNSRDMANLLNSLGLRYRDRYGLSGKVDDLDLALSAFRSALTLNFEDLLPMILHNTGLVLHDRFKQVGEREDLNESISVFEEALAKATVLERSRYVLGFVSALHTCFENDKEIVLVDKAIGFLNQAIATNRAPHPELRNWCRGLGHCYRQRYRHRGDLADLDRSVDAFSQVVNQEEKEPADRYENLGNLGTALVDRYQQTGKLPDLEWAIHVLEEAIQYATGAMPQYALLPSNLTIVYLLRFERRGSLTDLDRGIALCERATKFSPMDRKTEIICSNNLASLLLRRYQATGTDSDLERANQILEGEMKGTGSEVGAAFLGSNLAVGLRDRYLHTGKRQDLENAISALEEAISQTGERSPDLARLYFNLGLTLVDRFELSGDLSDLEGAISSYENALSRLAPTSPDFKDLVSNLGFALTIRFRRNDSREDLQRAVALCEQSVEQTDEMSPALPFRLNHLGIALRAQFDMYQDSESLDHAIDAYRWSVDRTLTRTTPLHRYLINLGNALVMRYDRTMRPSDLNEAIDVYQRVGASTSESLPTTPGVLNSLAIGLRKRYESSGHTSDLRSSVAAFEEAASKGIEVCVQTGLAAASNWGEWAFAREAWQEVVQAFGYAEQAITQLVRIQFKRSSKENWLKNAQGLAGHAAYALAKQGRLSDAAVAVEQGQARLLAEVLERNTAALQSLLPEHQLLHDRYQNTSTQLRRLEHSASYEIPLAATDVRSGVRNWRAARADLENVIKEIRRVPGFEGFLASTDFETIKECCTKNPLVYLTVTAAGGLALIVRGAAKEAVTPIWLPKLTVVSLRASLLKMDEKPIGSVKAGAQRSGLDKMQQAVVRGYWGSYALWRSEPHNSELWENWLAALDDMTNWLWCVAIGPLVECLKSEGETRATLITEGLLGILPLHAAWTKDESRKGERQYALDSVTFSYAPNARALAWAQEVARDVGYEALLAIDEPLPVSATPLPNSGREVESAISKFPCHRILRNQFATRDALLASLPEYSVLHMSCHAYANLTEPLESGMLMANNEVLTLRDFLSLRVQPMRLAILSACETGVRGITLPDEGFSLPAGLLQAGVAGVVGSFWSVADTSTALLMQRFYNLWREEDLEPAIALCEAQRWLRDTTTHAKHGKVGSNDRNLSVIPNIPVSELKDATYQDNGAKDFQHPFWWASFHFTGV